MSGVQRVFSGAPWEKTVGYCRAIRVGAQVFVSGTAPVAEGGGVFAPGDAYAQTKRCFEIALAAMAKLGAERRHVVRTRIYVTDIEKWNDYGRAHGELFHEHPPATAMVEVSALIDPAMLVEVEVDAVVAD
jgi:isochorismate pyruvate lyase